LAFWDFGVGIVTQPFYITLQVYELKNDFLHYCLVDSVFRISGWIFGTGSLLTLTALTADRFIAVSYHLRYQEIVTSRRVGIVLLLISGYSTLSVFMYVFALSFSYIQSIIALMAILMDMFFIFKMYRVIRRHTMQIQALHQDTMNVPLLKKSINPMYYMFGAFLVCYFPFVGTSIAQTLFGTTRNIKISFKVTEFIGFMNSLMNPMIYYWRIGALRTASYDLLKKINCID
jgi:hypothetical protein